LIKIIILGKGGQLASELESLKSYDQNWSFLSIGELNICDKVDEKIGRSKGSSQKLITFVKDRPGHDKRYAIDASKINKELGWSPSVTFEQGLAKTIDWFLKNKEWLENVTSGSYQEYYNKQYK